MAKLLKTGNLIARRIVGYEVVTELPELIEIGELKLYNGTMWRGLLEGESSLPAGTPWPVKGYKELDLVMFYSSFDLMANVANFKINDIGSFAIDVVDASGFRLVFADNFQVINQSNIALNLDNGLYYISQIVDFAHRLICTLFDFEGIFFLEFEGNININIKIYPPPPTP